MSAHLYAVPDPAPNETPGEHPAPVRAVPPLPSVTPADVNHQEHAHDPLDDTAGEQPDDVDDQDHEHEGENTETPGEQQLHRRALTLPNLRPYLDVRPLAELGPLAVEAGKGTVPLVVQAGRASGPPLLRFLAREARNVGRMIAWYVAGIVVLTRILFGWLSGGIGKRCSVGARFGLAAAAVYALAKTGAQFPIAPWIILGAALLLIVLASTGTIKVPESKSAKKGAKSNGAKDGKVEKPTTDKAPAAADDTPAAAEKEAAPAVPPRSIRAHLATLIKDPGATPTAPPAEAPEGAQDEALEGADDTRAEAPEEDPLTALIRAEIAGENGVHLQDLRPAMKAAFPHLSQASDKQLKEVLTGAGWNPSRKFRARGAVGLTGVHRDQLPPMPSPGSSPEASSGPLSATPHPSRPAKSSPSLRSSSPPEGWTEEDWARGWRWVQDPERGPSAWIVQHHEGR
ncbi:hypothetical protein ACIPQH_25095 [Streptomyces rubiginosohelvolus]|uniref:hypothetical protein n=1 Tax=Streptomyces rubiginosohelvolus TaxID=67362 RepID=UPI00380D2893